MNDALIMKRYVWLALCRTKSSIKSGIPLFEFVPKANYRDIAILQVGPRAYRVNF